jgi:hypothetical protein
MVHEVDAAAYGTVPPVMLGWWIKPEMATVFEIGIALSFRDDEIDWDVISKRGGKSRASY